MSQQRFRSHQHQGFAEGQGNLSSQDVEIVGRIGAVSNNHVDVAQLLDSKLILLRWEVFRIVRAELQESFRLGRAVLGTHTLHAVRQKHNKSRLTHPLSLTA
jgi:hypothetical protein